MVATGPTGLVRTLRVSLMLDVVLGLLVAVALPLAILAIPNTISVVAALLPPDVSQIEMIRAHGMALPAMVLTVPLAAMALRRVRAAPILVAGLALLAVADAAGGYAASTTVVGALRVLHGIGAGLLVSATLVAVWERSRLLRAVWAGVLAASLLTAQALALWPLDEVDSWKVTLQPYPILTGVALVLAALYLVLWTRSGEGAVVGGGRTVSQERGRLLTAAVPAVGIAALAVGSTFDWPPGLVVLAASLSILALLGLASVGAVDGAAGRAPAYTMLAVGRRHPAHRRPGHLRRARRAGRSRACPVCGRPSRSPGPRGSLAARAGEPAGRRRHARGHRGRPGGRRGRDCAPSGCSSRPPAGSC